MHEAHMLDPTPHTQTLIDALPWAASTRDSALRRLAEGEAITAVAEQLGIDRSTLWRWADAAKLPRQRTRRSGAERAAVRERALEMLARHDRSIAAVARELGVARTDVQAWAREAGLRHGDRVAARLQQLEQRPAAVAAPTAPTKRRTPTSPVTDVERLQRDLAQSRKAQDVTAQRLRDARKGSPWERITWALGMELAEILPGSVMGALVSGEVVKATFQHPRVDRVDAQCELALRDEALPLFRLFTAHRESAELRDEDIRAADEELARIERERVADLKRQGRGDLDPDAAVREAMARNMRIELDDGSLEPVEATARMLLRRRGVQLQ